MNSVLPAEEIPALKAALAELDRVIETLRFEVAQLKRLIFGARSERLEAVMDSEQLPLLQEMPEDAPWPHRSHSKPRRHLLPKDKPSAPLTLPPAAGNQRHPPFYRRAGLPGMRERAAGNRP